MAWDPPFEYEAGRTIMDVAFELNAKLARVVEHLAAIRVLLGEDDEEEAEEGD